MRRFFTEPQNISGDTAFIFEDSSHIKKVLRMEPGDEILIFDGTGYEYTACLTSIEKDKCEARITGKSLSLSEPSVKVWLFQGIPKTGKMETIIQKAVELGVCAVVPVIMDRCVTRINNKQAGEEKVRRWNKVSVEAVKQCGRGIIPRVHDPVSFEMAVSMMKNLHLAMMPYEELGHAGKNGLREALDFAPDAESIGIMVGPEGGFSDSEAELAKKENISMIGLGKRILRTETVASALIPIIMFYKNEI